MTVNAFISYSRDDFDTAQKIEQMLGELKIPCFFDSSSVRAGDSFNRKIAEALKSHNTLIAVISPSSMTSQWVLYEIGFAIGQEKRVIPFLTHIGLRNGLPVYMRDLHDVTSLEDLRSHLIDLAEGDVETEKKSGREEIQPPSSVIRELQRTHLSDLKVPESNDLYSSFEPVNSDLKLQRVRLRTTDGWVRKDEHSPYKRVQNHVHLVRDPVRPFEIQIGAARTLRPRAKPRGIELINADQFDVGIDLYGDEDRKGKNRWQRLVFADIATDPGALQAIYNRDKDDPEIRATVARNPNAPKEIKKDQCIFCRKDFYDGTERILAENGNALIFANDFPFGPYFHCIVMPKGDVHSWDEVALDDLYAVNSLSVEFLESSDGERLINEAAGVRFGLNSSIRHTVMGKRTTTAAGASVDHVHKQLWGMDSTSYNLANHLCHICDIYQRQKVDYLGSYLYTLRQGGFVIWEDSNAALYIPFGQISAHELQIMMKRVGARTLLDLRPDEIASLTLAEFYALQIYRKLEIVSFNEVLLSRSFDMTAGNRFRLIMTFITREVDLAISELSLAYVVNEFPESTRDAVDAVWNDIAAEYPDSLIDDLLKT